MDNCFHTPTPRSCSSFLGCHRSQSQRLVLPASHQHPLQIGQWRTRERGLPWMGSAGARLRRREQDAGPGGRCGRDAWTAAMAAGGGAVPGGLGSCLAGNWLGGEVGRARLQMQGDQGPTAMRARHDLGSVKAGAGPGTWQRTELRLETWTFSGMGVLEEGSLLCHELQPRRRPPGAGVRPRWEDK